MNNNPIIQLSAIRISFVIRHLAFVIPHFVFWNGAHDSVSCVSGHESSQRARDRAPGPVVGYMPTLSVREDWLNLENEKEILVSFILSSRKFRAIQRLRSPNRLRRTSHFGNDGDEGSCGN